MFPFTFAEIIQTVIDQFQFELFDVAPRTLTAKAHRPAYASDGDYFSKPNTEEIIDAISEMMRE